MSDKEPTPPPRPASRYSGDISPPAPPAPPTGRDKTLEQAQIQELTARTHLWGAIGHMLKIIVEPIAAEMIKEARNKKG